MIGTPPGALEEGLEDGGEEVACGKGAGGDADVADPAVEAWPKAEANWVAPIVNGLPSVAIPFEGCEGFRAIFEPST